MNIDSIDNDVMASSHRHARRSACETYDALVLDAALRQSLATLRSLGRQGLHVAVAEVAHVLEESPYVPAFSSRWCKQSFVSPASEGTEAYLTYLEGLLERGIARVLIPSSDATVALLRQYRERLEERGARIALAKDPALGIAINKEQTLEIAERCPVHLSLTRGSDVRTILLPVQAAPARPEEGPSHMNCMKEACAD